MFSNLPYEISEQIILQICSLNITNKFYPDRIKEVYNPKVHKYRFLFENLNILKTLLIQNLIINKERLIINAVKNDNFPILKFLVEQGCDPTTQNNAVIICSVCKNNFPMLKFLVEQGCDPTAQDNIALTVAEHNGNFLMIKFLIERGCEWNRPDPWVVAGGSLFTAKRPRM